MCENNFFNYVIKEVYLKKMLVGFNLYYDIEGVY